MCKNILIALFIVIFPYLAAADVDQRTARDALNAGDIRPLTELLAQVERECRGDLVEVELENDDGGWVYEISLIGPNGDVGELEYHAKTFALLEAEGRRLDLLKCVPPGTPD